MSKRTKPSNTIEVDAPAKSPSSPPSRSTMRGTISLAYSPAWPNRAWRSNAIQRRPTPTRQRQPRRGRHQRHGRPRTRQHRRARRQAGHGGKGNLFKQFADLDVFDLEVGSEDPQTSSASASCSNRRGGINLEDIKAPDCFLIEETLRKTLHIPVFHDDQHGTRSFPRRTAQRSRSRRQGTRLPESRLLGRRRGGDCNGRTLRASGRRPRKHHPLRSKGRRSRGPR